MKRVSLDTAHIEIWPAAEAGQPESGPKNKVTEVCDWAVANGTAKAMIKASLARVFMAPLSLTRASKALVWWGVCGLVVDGEDVSANVASVGAYVVAWAGVLESEDAIG